MTQATLRRLIDLPGLDALEMKALMKPSVADPDNRDGDAEVIEAAKAAFGLTPEEADAVSLPDDWDGIEHLDGFDLTDAFAVPGAPAALSGVDPDNIVLSMDGSTVTVEPGGTVRIKTTKVVIEAADAELTGSWKVGGDVVVDGDVRAGTVSLRQHVHLASGGSGIGGPPRP